VGRDRGEWGPHLIDRPQATRALLARNASLDCNDASTLATCVAAPELARLACGESFSKRVLWKVRTALGNMLGDGTNEGDDLHQG
jgi:hypothetical protein